MNKHMYLFEREDGKGLEPGRLTLTFSHLLVAKL